MYQNEVSTIATRVAAFTLHIAAAAANLKESSVDEKSFNATHVCSGLIIILRFSTRPSDFRTYLTAVSKQFNEKYCVNVDVADKWVAIIVIVL